MRIRPWIRAATVSTSVLCYAEALEHLRGRADFARHLASLRVLTDDVPLNYVTTEISERYGALRRQLRPPYGPGLIGDIDTLIAATALELDLTVVTTDGDFRRVPDLKLLLLPRGG